MGIPGNMTAFHADTRVLEVIGDPAFKDYGRFLFPARVGTKDGIAYYGTMENRIRKIRAQGTNAKITIYGGLPHGFGLGEGTAAEGWLDEAVAFWEENMK